MAGSLNVVAPALPIGPSAPTEITAPNTVFSKGAAEVNAMLPLAWHLANQVPLTRDPIVTFLGKVAHAPAKLQEVLGAVAVAASVVLKSLKQQQAPKVRPEDNAAVLLTRGSGTNPHVLPRREQPHVGGSPLTTQPPRDTSSPQVGPSSDVHQSPVFSTR